MTTIEAAGPVAHDPAYWDGVARSYIPSAQLTIPVDIELHGEAEDDSDPITH